MLRGDKIYIERKIGWVRTPSHEVSFTFNPTCDDDVDDDDDDGEDDEYDDADDDDGDDDDTSSSVQWSRKHQGNLEIGSRLKEFVWPSRAHRHNVPSQHRIRR